MHRYLRDRDQLQRSLPSHEPMFPGFNYQHPLSVPFEGREITTKPRSVLSPLVHRGKCIPGISLRSHPNKLRFIETVFEQV